MCLTAHYGLLAVLRRPSYALPPGLAADPRAGPAPRRRVSFDKADWILGEWPAAADPKQGSRQRMADWMGS